MDKKIIEFINGLTVKEVYGHKYEDKAINTGSSDSSIGHELIEETNIIVKSKYMPTYEQLKIKWAEEEYQSMLEECTRLYSRKRK